LSRYAPDHPANPSGTWKILAIVDAKSSNIIKALHGDPPFDGSIFPQMPADGSPYADLPRSNRSSTGSTRTVRTVEAQRLRAG
jgi:hypothetical protein